MKVIKSFCLLIITLHFERIFSQLSDWDVSTIAKTINSHKDEKTGLYGATLESTFQAVYSLKALGEEINSASRICKDVSYETTNLNLNTVLLGELLNCKVELENLRRFLDVSQQNKKLSSVFERISIESHYGLLDEEKVMNYYNLVKSNYENGLFVESLSNDSVLLSNSFGLRIFSIVYEKTQSDEVKSEIANSISEPIKHINKYFHEINDVS